MAELLMTRQGYSLRPFDQHAEEDMLKLGEGPFYVKVTKPRSLIQNRLYWASLRSICANGGFEDGEDILHDVTKMGAGCFKVIQLSGLTYRVPDSTAFSRLDQTAFNAYFDRAISFWRSERLYDWLAPELRAKIEDTERRAVA